MADNFSSDFLAGAQLVNMGWERQERIQHLQAQAAMQAIQERQLAAQAEMLTAHSELYRKQAMAIDEAKKQEQADLAAANDLYHTITETTGATPEEARAHVDQVLSYKNPALGLKIQKIRTEEAKQKKYEADAAPVQLGGVVPLRNENGETIGHAVQTGRNSMHIIDTPSSKSKLPEKQQMAQRYSDLMQQETALTTALDNVGFANPLQKQEVESNLARVRNEMKFYQKEMGDKSFQVVDIEGKKYIQTATGKLMPVEKDVTYTQFVDRHLNEFIKESASEKEAKQKLDNLWNEIQTTRGGSTQPSAPTTSGFKDIGGFKVRIKSK